MAEPQHLDYHLNYPSSGRSQDAAGAGAGAGADSDDYVFVVDEESAPVVVLFGWAGCNDRYLAKYSAIYEDRGLITLRYTAPVGCLFWRRHRVRRIAERLVKLLLELRLHTHPVIVHVFSNGGAFLYQNFSAALDRSGRPVRVRGVIYDSAPGKRRVGSLYRAVSAILGGSAVYNVPAALLLTLFLSVVWLVEVVSATLWPSADRVQSNPIVGLRDEPIDWPQHFIYSKTDDLIPYTDVESFVGHRQRLGARVTTLRFEDSPHVKHYTHNRAAYVGSVCTFINRCLAASGTDDANAANATAGR